MKTSEFKEAVEELGFIIEFRYGDRFYVSLKERIVAKGFYTKMYSLETTWDDFSEMVYYKQRELFEKMVEYVATPISEREEEKRYRLRSTNKHTKHCYLSTLSSGCFDIFSITLCDLQYASEFKHKVIFTESELKHIDETGFERKEVEQ